MTPATLRRVAELLYGSAPGWDEMLAEDLSVNIRTCQRWASGAREIPDLEEELANLCNERARELSAMAIELGYGADKPLGEKVR